MTEDDLPKGRRVALVVIVILLAYWCFGCGPMSVNADPSTEHLEQWTIYGVLGPIAGVRAVLRHDLPDDMYAAYYGTSDAGGHLRFSLSKFSAGLPAILDLELQGYRPVEVSLTTCVKTCQHDDIHLELVNLKAVDQHL